MKAHLLGTLALIAASAGTGAAAQGGPETAPVICADKAMVGRWLYDPQGNTIGSVRALTDRGRTAVVMLGSYFQPGSHEIRVPACEITVAAGGRVTLGHDVVDARNVSPPQ